MEKRNLLQKSIAVFRLLKEGVSFAWNELKSNKFRSSLSLLGVSIGIFCIVAVFTAIDALKNNVQKSFSKISNSTVMVTKWPPFGPEDENGNELSSSEMATAEYAWWDYMRRPDVNFDDYRFLKQNCPSASAVTYLPEFRALVQRGRKKINDCGVGCAAGEFSRIVNLGLSDGRFPSETESEKGSPVALIGYEIAQELFPGENPLNKTIKLNGHMFVVQGVFEKQGESIVNVVNTDDYIYIPYASGKALVSMDDMSGNVFLLPKAGVDKDDFKSEVRSLMRIGRRLRPIDKNNFSVASMSAFGDIIKKILGSINKVGWILAAFSLLIGGFGIANIMFVSVKERTKIIGIEKALGAKKYLILTQFLTEAVFLAVAGAAVGILLIALILFVAPIPPEYEVTLSVGNIISGVLIASIIGIASGMLPAWSAANLNPVDAINSK